MSVSFAAFVGEKICPMRENGLSRSTSNPMMSVSMRIPDWMAPIPAEATAAAIAHGAAIAKNACSAASKTGPAILRARSHRHCRACARTARRSAPEIELRDPSSVATTADIANTLPASRAFA